MEADGLDDSKWALKKIAFPILGDDALPSSIAINVLTCIGKWEVKLRVMIETVDEELGPPVAQAADASPARDKEIPSAVQPLFQLLP